MSNISKPKFNPFKILAFLLYGSYSWMHWTNDLTVELRLGPMSRFLKIPNSRLRSYLEWLHEKGYIENLELSYGRADATIRFPSNLDPSAIVEASKAQQFDSIEEES